jgi:hypothetical protein
MIAGTFSYLTARAGGFALLGRGEPAGSSGYPVDSTQQGWTATSDSGEMALLQLPPDIRDFIGRKEQISFLWTLLSDQNADKSITVVAISGKGGVGKTALAVHLAHQLSAHFPDGQLYANLRGVEARPVEPGEVLAAFLRALGVDGATIPEDAEECSRLYRARLANRRILVLLDNVGGEAQVRPLIPGSPNCAVIITSRIQLVALEYAVLVDLNVLDEDAAVDLIGKVAGATRVGYELDAAREITRLCGRLPLAIRIAGARLAARTHWQLSDLIWKEVVNRGGTSESRGQGRTTVITLISAGQPRAGAA